MVCQRFHSANQFTKDTTWLNRLLWPNDLELGTLNLRWGLINWNGTLKPLFHAIRAWLFMMLEFRLLDG
jgi:hypothetical protein